MGHFNATQNPEDRCTQLSFSAISLAFNKMLNGLEVIEIHTTNKKFSWSNFRENASLARLDRCFINTQGHTLFSQTSYTFLPRTASDHTPLKINFYNLPPMSKGFKKSFHFENHWFSYLDMVPTVKTSWV